MDSGSLFDSVYWDRYILGLADARGLIFSLGVGYLVYAILICIYRITLHPLHQFPGPKLAAATYAYELWYDAILGGRYTRRIQELHDIYGPIIRINPDELHCSDPKFINAIYASGNKPRDKTTHFLNGFPTLPMSGFGTVDHKHHRIRRSALNTFFGRAQISKLEHLIQSNVQTLCDKFLAHRGQGPIFAREAFSCLTTDTITEYCFGTSSRFLNQDGFKQNYVEPIGFFFSISHTMRHFPWIRYIFDWSPMVLVKLINPSMWSFMVFSEVETLKRVKEVKAEFAASPQDSRPTVFSALMNSSLPEKEKTVKRLHQEGIAMVIGGTETTAAMLSFLTYQILANPTVYEKLLAELTVQIPDPKTLPSWSTLENIPYLSAIVHEGLRLSYGISQRLPRIATHQDLKYEGRWRPPHSKQDIEVAHVVPRGYAIGMSAVVTHSNESIFPKALEFIPERWIDEDGKSFAGLDPYLLSFSKGSRQCVGMQLAYAEIYTCIAALALRVFPFMKLYKTGPSDVKYDHDELIGRAKKDSKGIRLEMMD